MKKENYVLRGKEQLKFTEIGLEHRYEVVLISTIISPERKMPL